MKKILIILIIAASATFGAQAQKHYDLTLEQSIAIAKKESYNMQSLELDALMAGYSLRAAKGELGPKVNLNFVLPSYTKSVREWSDSTGIYFYDVEDMRVSTVLNITQPLPTDGQIYVRSTASANNDYYNDSRTTNLNTRVGIRQPLDVIYGYNSILSSLKRAKLDYERSMKNLKREDLNLIYQVSSSYYSLVSQEKGAEIARMNLDRQSEAYEMSKNKYSAGLIREVEALQMEVDMAEARNSYDLAMQNLTSARNSFKQLIGIEMDAVVNLRTDLAYEPVQIDEEKAVEMALQKRLEIREREIQVELQKLTLKQQRANRLPSIDVDAYYERAGTRNERGVGGSYEQSAADAWDRLRERPAGYGVDLTVSVPILDWGTRKSNVRSSQARLKQAELSKDEERRIIETDVRNAVANLKGALARLQLLEKNVSVAEKSFSITLQRFSDGDIDSQSLALERTRLNQAQKSHLEAFISYQLGLSDMMRKTFYDFQNDRPIE